MVRKQDQIRGCLLGAAAGDAMGYCVKELSPEEIQEKYGPQGLQGYDTYNGYAPISSHTQMAMFTANGLLFGATRGALRGVMAPYVNYLEAFYRDWADTQRSRKAQGRPFAWLSCLEELHSRRAPDNTVLYALEQPRAGTMDEPINHSRGPSGLTRCMPIGLFLNPRETGREEIALLGAESAALTQGDPLGFLPAAVLADLINRIVYDRPDSFRSALHKSISAVNRQFSMKYRQLSSLWELLYRAEELADKGTPPWEALAALSCSDAPGVLAGACYVCLKFPGDFDRSIVAAVNHGGDSAATGAVAGGLLGAMLGTEGIPEFYLEPLELRGILEELADDLFQGCPMSRDPNLFDDQWDQKYIQRTY